MPWYCWIFTVIALILLNRLWIWFVWRKVVAVQRKPNLLDVDWKAALGKESVLPVAQDISEELQTSGTSGVVPSGVSWIQTSHAGGVAVGPRRLGFGLGRKKGRKNALRRHSRNYR